MEIVKNQSENIVQTKDLDLIKENYIKSDNCDKMVANAQDNQVSTASETVTEDQQQQKSIFKLDTDIPEKEITEKNNLVNLKEGKSCLTTVNLSDDEIANEGNMADCDSDEQEDIEEDENDEKIRNVPTSSDVDEDEDVDEVDEESDGVMILDSSSDEENERKHANDLNHSFEDDDDDVEDSADSNNDSDDYDDNDLMDDVVMSAAGKSKIHKLRNSSKTIDGNKIVKLIKHRKKMKKSFSQLSYRCHVKNRSIKCLNSKIIMHNVEELHHQNIKLHNSAHNLELIDDNDDYQYSAESLTNSETGLSIGISNTSMTLSPRESIIELDSSPDKYNKLKEIDIKLTTTNKNQSDIPEIIPPSSCVDDFVIIELDSSPDKDKSIKNIKEIDKKLPTNNNKSELSDNIPLIKHNIKNNETDIIDNIENNITEESSPIYEMILQQENIVDLDLSSQKSKNLQETGLKVNPNDQSEFSEIIPITVKDNNFEEITKLTSEISVKTQPIEKTRETIKKSDNIEDIKSIDNDEHNIKNYLDHFEKKKQDLLVENNNKLVNKVESVHNGENVKIEYKEKLVKSEKDLKKIDENRNDYNTGTIDLEEIVDINIKTDNKLEIEEENNLIESNNDLTKTKENRIQCDVEILLETNQKNNDIVPEDDNNKDNNTTSQTFQLTRKRPRSISVEDEQCNKIPTIATSTPIQQQSTELSGKTQQNLEKLTTTLYQQDKEQCMETEDDDIIVHPTKKLRAELETNFRTHDRILSEYIERTSNDSPNDIDKHISQLTVEIQTLNDMIKAKEIEWNNMLHLKKVKEEICSRLNRKKQVIELMAIKVGEISNSQQAQQLNLINNNSGKSDMILEGNRNTLLKIPNINNGNASALAAISAASSNLFNLTGNSTISSTGGSTAQTILQNRANMKSSDLAKEKANTQKLHRNILPKPGTSSTSFPIITSSTTTTSSSIANSQQQQHQLGIGNLLNTVGSSSILLTNSQNNNLQQQQFPLSLSNIATGSLLNHINNNNNNGLLHQQQQPILNNYLTAAATVQQQLGELFNGHHQTQQQQQQNAQNLMIGRQGVFKDVKSIIADYRQRHPEQVPRRGRRMKSTNSNDITSCGQRGNSTDLNSILNRFEGNSRPSSNDSSSHSMTNIMPSSVGNLNSNNSANVSFKDALLQIAKISGQNADRLNAVVAASAIGKSNSGAGGGTQVSSQHQSSSFGSPYPEVTLHPVSTLNIKNESTGSLLHGILTKYTRPNPSSPTATIVASAVNNPTSSSSTSLLVHQLNQQHTTCTPTSTTNNYNSTFSPTLARLLTAPERMANSNIQNTNNNNNNSHGSHSAILASGTSPVTNSYPSGSNGGGLNLSKVVGHNSEITITPVINSSLNLHQSLFQQQIQKQQQQQQIKDILSRNVGPSGDKIKGENIINMDDEADDSVDRLVIDEGGDSSIGAEEQYRIAPRAIGQEFNENEVPACQGCKKQEAQFVCAGCGNQWYCSRECQVQAWDEHSEVCTG